MREKKKRHHSLECFFKKQATLVFPIGLNPLVSHGWQLDNHSFHQFHRSPSPQTIARALPQTGSVHSSLPASPPDGDIIEKPKKDMKIREKPMISPWSWDMNRICLPNFGDLRISDIERMGFVGITLPGRSESCSKTQPRSKLVFSKHPGEVCPCFRCSPYGRAKLKLLK